MISASQPTCNTCQHWIRHDDGRMNQHDMHPCNHGQVWTYLPPQHTCHQWTKHKNTELEAVNAARKGDLA